MPGAVGGAAPPDQPADRRRGPFDGPPAVPRNTTQPELAWADSTVIRRRGPREVEQELLPLGQ
jgi:hypothetical protein